MKRRVVRVLVLFWIAWYITGPVCETFDYWDPPRQEVHDVLFYAGGGITLVAAGFGLALALFRKFRERCLAAGARRFHGFVPAPFPLLSRWHVNSLEVFIHPPPVSLRI